MKISIFGTGSVGSKLKTLFVEAGQEVVSCSREVSDGVVSFKEGAEFAEMVVLAVPYAVLADLLPTLAKELANKIVIDATNPLNDDWSPLLLGQETSAAEEVAKLLPQSQVLKAFNTIFADVMGKEFHNRDGQKITAFIAGDTLVAKEKVSEIIVNMGLAPLDVGALAAARYLEAMAHLNIQIAVGQGGTTNAVFIYNQAK